MSLTIDKALKENFAIQDIDKISKKPKLLSNKKSEEVMNKLNSANHPYFI